MSSDEMESFGVSREDIDEAVEQSKTYGRKGKFSKEKAIYGLWADQDSDEEDGSSRKRSKSDYSRPVDFVSGGVKGGHAEADGSESDTERMDDDIVKSLEPEEKMDDGEADPVNTAGLPKAFVSSSQQRSKTLGTVGHGKESRPGFKPKKGIGMPVKPDKAFGSWEKHTKGIGLKLLQKMGYEAGTGLGRDGSGINRPIEVKLRGGRGAVAYYGNERTKQSLEDNPPVDSEEEEERSFKAELQTLRGQEVDGKKKRKTVYRTAAEVRASGVKTSGKKVVQKKQETVKVLDLTGPVEKVYHGYDSIHAQHSHPDGQPMVTESVSFLPELLHNVELLVDQSESDILHLDRQLQHEQNRVINLRHEREMLSKTLQKEREELERVNEVKEVVGKLTERAQPNSGADSLSLDECASSFQRLQSSFQYEYNVYGLSRLAVPIVFPLIKEQLIGWQAFNSTDMQCLNLFLQWRDLLGDATAGSNTAVPSEHDMPVYDRLVWEVWMPQFRAAMTKWSPRSPLSVISFLELWSIHLPVWVHSHVLDSWVFPRLQAEVERWNPTTDAQPIDSWIHPWLQLMGHRLEPLYAPVRHRLATALSKWDPSDGSAKAILTPWVGVFSQGSMDAFMIRCILPKLAECLQKRLVINPAHQDLEPFKWVMAWRSMVPTTHFVNLLENYFFRPWMSVLSQWLQPINNPNYEEVIHWFSGWKEQFDQELLDHPQVASHFGHAVEIMQHMVSNPGSASRPDAMPYPHMASGGQEHFDHPAMAQMRQRMGVAASTPPVLDFKEIVQRKARESGLSFLPDRMHDAHMLYRIGRCSIYFNKNVVFCRMADGAYQPVSLDQLLSMAA